MAISIRTNSNSSIWIGHRSRVRGLYKGAIVKSKLRRRGFLQKVTDCRGNSKVIPIIGINNKEEWLLGGICNKIWLKITKCSYNTKTSRYRIAVEGTLFKVIKCIDSNKITRITIWFLINNKRKICRWWIQTKNLILWMKILWMTPFQI